MLANLLVLTLLFILAYLARLFERKDYKNRWSKRAKLKKAFDDSIEFWKKVFANPIRLTAIMIVLVCQKNVVIMIGSIAILEVIPFSWALEQNHSRLSNPSILGCINWKKPNVQRIATVGCVAVSMNWLLGRCDCLENYEIVGWLMTIVVFVFSYLLIIVRNK